MKHLQNTTSDKRLLIWECGKAARFNGAAFGQLADMDACFVAFALNAQP